MSYELFEDNRLSAITERINRMAASGWSLHSITPYVQVGSEYYDHIQAERVSSDTWYLVVMAFTHDDTGGGK